MRPRSEMASTAATDTMDLEGVGIAVHDFGAGIPVVALHCSGASGEQWQALAEVLGPGRRILAPDFHGCGRSAPWHGRRPLRLADQAAMVLAVMDRCHGPVDLVGHSYCGAVALKVALRHGGRLRSLTLVEPSAFHLLALAGARRHHAQIRRVASDVWQAAVTGDDWGGMERFVDYWNGAGTWGRMRFETQARLAQQTAVAATDFSALFAETEPLEACSGIAVPTLILHGTRSPGPSRRICALLADVLQDVRIVAVDGAGHMLPFTHAEAVNRAIRDHLMTAGGRTAVPAAGLAA